jgi:hypothetical protein
MKKNKKGQKILWIFLHLPKTGGTTFSDQVKKHLKKEEVIDTSQMRYNLADSEIRESKVKVILGHATYYGIHKMFPGKTPRYFVFLRDPAERFVSSYNFEMRTKKGENTPFNEWYNSQLKDEMTYFLDMKFRGKEGVKANLPRKFLPFFGRIFMNKKVYMLFQKIHGMYVSFFHSSEKIKGKKLENAKRLLDICWHVGFIKDLDKSLKILFKEMGLPEKWRNENITEKSKKFFAIDGKTREKIYADNRYDKELYDYALSLMNKRKQESQSL